MIAQVRYYETFYLISGPDGERVYTSNDAKVAAKVLAVLNGVEARRVSIPRKPARKVSKPSRTGHKAKRSKRA